MNPKISVVMTVFNSAQYLTEAMESVLGQTYGDYEFIIVNDASTDNSLEIIKSYEDHRISLINNEVNSGVAVSSNIGLDMANGNYIVRMDSDDISVPTRFEKQLKFMEENQNISVVGSWAKVFGNKMNEVVWQYPSHHDEIRANHIFNPRLHHSSVMMRKSIIDKYKLRYNPAFTRALDYDFWVRHGELLRFANIEEVLLWYRKHPGQISTGHYQEQQSFAGEVRRSELANLGIHPTEREFALHQMLSMRRYDAELEFLEETRLWLEKLWKANVGKIYYHADYFEQVLANKWVESCSTVAVSKMDIATEIWSKIYHTCSLHQKVNSPEKDATLAKLDGYLETRVNKNIAILGTGRAAIELFNKFKQKYSITAFINNECGSSENTLMDVPVVTYDQYIQNPIHYGSLIISSILGDHDQDIINKMRTQIENEDINIVSWKDLC